MSGAVLTVAIIGCGSVADTLEDDLQPVPGWLPFPYSHATAFGTHTRTRIVAAVDPDPERLHRFCDRWEIPGRYRDTADLLEHERVDIAAVASPTWNHHDAFVAVAEAGVKGVFLEKPVARTLREADRMAAVADACGTAAIVNHFRSFDPSYRAAARMIAEGAIGDVSGAVVIWGEGLSQGGCHLFDLVRLLLARRVQHVYAVVDDDSSLVDPGGSLLLALEGGAVVTAHMPWRIGPPPQIDLAGRAGMIRMSNYHREVIRYDRINDRPVPAVSSFPARSATRSGMLVAIDELIEQMEFGTVPGSGLPEGRAALEITAAALASGRAGVPVALPFLDLDAVVEAWL
jgi:predicted dehydrogenase